MGLVQPDLIIRDALTDAFATLTENTDALDDVFGERPDDERVSIREWFSNNVVPVRLGFPRNAADVPALYVALMSSAEDTQVVGSTFPEIRGLPNASSVSDEEGSFFRTGIRVGCWSLNADLTVWMQGVATWMLLGHRSYFKTRGMIEQQLQVMDFEPLPNWFPDFSFRRDMVLSSKHTVTVKTAFPTVQGVSVTATSVDQVLEQASVTLRRRPR